MRLVQKSDLAEWDTLLNQLRNDYHMSDWDKKELIRLNHLVMETCQDIHNTNMLEGIDGIGPKQTPPINSAGTCKYCNTKSVNDTISNGSHEYYCTKCELLIRDIDIES